MQALGNPNWTKTPLSSVNKIRRLWYRNVSSLVVLQTSFRHARLRINTNKLIASVDATDDVASIEIVRAKHRFVNKHYNMYTLLKVWNENSNAKEFEGGLHWLGEI